MDNHKFKRCLDEYLSLPLYYNCVFAFSIGYLFSPLSYSAVSYLAFVISYELVLYNVTNRFGSDRIYPIIFGILGWIIGRLLFKRSFYR